MDKESNNASSNACGRDMVGEEYDNQRWSSSGPFDPDPVTLPHGVSEADLIMSGERRRPAEPRGRGEAYIPSTRA